MPLVVTLTVGERTVLDRHALVESAAEDCGHRRGQRDLGDHEQHLTTGVTDVLRQPEVDLGLPAAGHAVQERGAKLARIGERGELIECGLLFGRQHASGIRDEIGHSRALERITVLGFRPQSDQPARGKSGQHVPGDTPIAQFPCRKTDSGRRQDVESRALLRGQSWGQSWGRGWRQG
jgi:hypothetical protein